MVMPASSSFYEVSGMPEGEMSAEHVNAIAAELSTPAVLVKGRHIDGSVQFLFEMLPNPYLDAIMWSPYLNGDRNAAIAIFDKIAQDIQATSLQLGGPGFGMSVFVRTHSHYRHYAQTSTKARG